MEDSGTIDADAIVVCVERELLGGCHWVVIRPGLSTARHGVEGRIL